MTAADWIQALLVAFAIAPVLGLMGIAAAEVRG